MKGYYRNVKPAVAAVAAAASALRKYRSAPKRTQRKKSGSAAAGSRRRAVGARTRQLRRTNREAGESDFTARRAQYRNKPLTLRRQVGLMQEKLRFGFAQLNAFGSANGFVALTNGQTAAGAQYQVPCHLFDLTSVRNLDSTTTFIPAATSQHLRFTNELDTHTIQWSNIIGQNFSLETSAEANLATDVAPHARSILTWASVRLLLYAAIQVPTKFQIDICQFTDERLVPNASSQGVTTTVTDTFATAFWEYMCKPYMRNPLETQNTNYARYVKFLKRMTVYMDPKETTEVSASRFKQINLFLRLNQGVVYDWDNNDRVAFANAGGAVQDIQVNTGTVSNSAHPRKRIFLMIRALSGFNRNATIYNGNIHPSYDIRLQTCHLHPN